MFEIVDGRTTDYGQLTDTVVTGILLAYPSAFGSGELKIKNCFLNGCLFLEIRLTHGIQLLPNIMGNKLVTAFSNLFK